MHMSTLDIPQKAHEENLPRGLCLFDIAMDENRRNFREDGKNDHKDKHDDSVWNDAFHDFIDGVFLVQPFQHKQVQTDWR